jgi:replicative DNA helicase
VVSRMDGHIDRIVNSTPPHSLAAEKSVLGCMLRQPQCVADVVAVIRDIELYTDANQKVYRAIVGLWDRGQPVDAVAVANVLHERKQVEDVGGYAYLAELLEAAPTAAHAEHYAQIIHGKFILRSLVHAGTEIVRDGYDPSGPAGEMLEQAERRIFNLSQVGFHGQAVSLDEVLDEVSDRIDSKAEHGTPGRRWGRRRWRRAWSRTWPPPRNRCSSPVWSSRARSWGSASCAPLLA